MLFIGFWPIVQREVVPLSEHRSIERLRPEQVRDNMCCVCVCEVCTQVSLGYLTNYFSISVSFPVEIYPPLYTILSEQVSAHTY